MILVINPRAAQAVRLGVGNLFFVDNVGRLPYIDESTDRLAIPKVCTEEDEKGE